MDEKSNIAEELNFREEYFDLGRELFGRILTANELGGRKLVIAIGGESGCGKSTTAYCLQKEFLANGFPCTTLHMDSYFIRAPKDNHQFRVKNIDSVGPQELNMDLLNEHINAFKNFEASFTIPVVSYKENRFFDKTLQVLDIDVLIIEGVYSFLCENLDQKIFINRTYHETHHNRKQRTREDYDPIVEAILEIEHQIVHPMIQQADFVVDKDYSVR